jgi:hypothetical protein
MLNLTFISELDPARRSILPVLSDDARRDGHHAGDDTLPLTDLHPTAIACPLSLHPALSTPADSDCTPNTSTHDNYLSAMPVRSCRCGPRAARSNGDMSTHGHRFCPPCFLFLAAMAMITWKPQRPSEGYHPFNRPNLGFADINGHSILVESAPP